MSLRMPRRLDAGVQKRQTSLGAARVLPAKNGTGAFHEVLSREKHPIQAELEHITSGAGRLDAPLAA